MGGGTYFAVDTANYFHQKKITRANFPYSGKFHFTQIRPYCVGEQIGITKLELRTRSRVPAAIVDFVVRVRRVACGFGVPRARSVAGIRPSDLATAATVGPGRSRASRWRSLAGGKHGIKVPWTRTEGVSLRALHQASLCISSPLPNQIYL